MSIRHLEILLATLWLGLTDWVCLSGFVQRGEAIALLIMAQAIWGLSIHDYMERKRAKPIK